MRPEDVIVRIHYTEKALRLLEEQNTITLIVDRKATKHQVKLAVEKLFDVKVESVRTLITPRGEKKAYVKLAKGYDAREIASRLGAV